MRSFITCCWLVGAGLLMSAIVTFTGPLPSSEVLGGDKSDRPTTASGQTVSYLKEVRPILAQHCFACHGPDEAKRKGKLRLDLKVQAFAERRGKHVIAAGDPKGSLVWERITTNERDQRMPPEGKGEPLTTKQIATLKTWIEQGANWQDHWSFLPPSKPALPKVSDQAWVRDPLDAFVLARLEKEGLKPAAEASREVWLRRATFDLTGLPPTPAEIDEFLKDKSSDAYEKQVDRLLKSQRYGERQAQEWLDLARYADTSGYQNDSPRKIWKWREWVINAYNANMPFDQFVVEQLAGDLLPNATLAQKVATGFNRNHPTNSEAGEEEDEYRSAYVIDRVNTTATVFMGLTMACAQCHDHKYDAISQRDYYSFYSFFNNIKERDSDFLNPRPSIPVPNPDQEPRLADLKNRIAALKQRLDSNDPLTDAAQKEWEARTLRRLSPPIVWTTARPSGMLSRNGSLLKLLDDGSVLAAGATPVKDTYDLLLHPGKKRISALRLEVLPDDSEPERATGRSTDGRFNLSAVEIRHTTVSDAQDPPLVYLSRAEADLNQKIKDDPAAFDMFPGQIESAVVVEPVGGPGGQGGGGFRGGWSIVGDERRKPHEAILLPLEPIETNEASVIRISLHHLAGSQFKSLIGRFRISYTGDDRIRELLLPAQSKLWSSIGPFPAEDATKTYSTVFEPEKDIKSEPLDLKKSYPKVLLTAGAEGKGAATPAGKSSTPSKPAEPGKPEVGPMPKTVPAKSEEPKPDAGAPMKSAEKKESPENDVAKTPKPPAIEPGELKPAGAPEVAPTDEKSPAKKGFGKFGKKPTDSDGLSKDEVKTDNAPPDAKVGPGGAKGPPKQEKLTWAEQRTWRDGSPARLQGGAGAYYFTRKIVSTQPRTVMLQIDGPAGFKVWLNGEPVQSSAPPPPAPAAVPPKADGKADNKEEPPSPDMEVIDIDLILGRARSRTEKKFRIGLRQGENEIVVKAVYSTPSTGPRKGPFGGEMAGPAMGGPGGGNVSFSFNLTPEGDDVITHEVAKALRVEELERIRGAAFALVAGSGVSLVTRPPATTETPVSPAGLSTKDAAPNAERKKVSLVGEKSAPAKAEEEEKLTPAERRRKVLREHFRSKIDPLGRLVAEELERLKDDERDLKRQMPETLVMDEMEIPRQTYIFIRGVYKNHGEKVSPATPAALPPMPAEFPRNRLGLARWLVSGQHPLTARVLVNRIWQQYFGTGFVRTAEDFGVRGELPTHADLLDYLAAELVESRWNLKGLHKRIVLSAIYRQASATSKEKLERDPENRLLSRGPRLRLTAEMVRDNALAISGLIFEKIGGESVKPVQPANAWKSVDGNFAVSAYRRDRDEKQYRRALYVYWKRGSPYPSMLTFDAVPRDACTMTRATTTTPLQALTLLNDPAYVEFAKMLGQRMLKDKEALGRAKGLSKTEEDAKRLTYGFRLCTSRAPTDKEVEVLRKLLDDQRAHFKADAAAAKKLLAVGDAKVGEAVDPAEAAAWASVANALLNLDATIYR